MSKTQGLSFGEFLSLEEGSNNYCDSIKDPKLRKQCKKMFSKTARNVTYGGYFGRGKSNGQHHGAGTGPGPGTGGGHGPGDGSGGGAYGGSAGAGGAAGSGSGSGGAGAGTGGGA